MAATTSTISAASRVAVRKSAARSEQKIKKRQPASGNTTTASTTAISTNTTVLMPGDAIPAGVDLAKLPANSYCLQETQTATSSSRALQQPLPTATSSTRTCSTTPTATATRVLAVTTAATTVALGDASDLQVGDTILGLVQEVLPDRAMMQIAGKYHVTKRTNSMVLLTFLPSSATFRLGTLRKQDVRAVNVDEVEHVGGYYRRGDWIRARVIAKTADNTVLNTFRATDGVVAVGGSGGAGGAGGRGAGGPAGREDFLPTRSCSSAPGEVSGLLEPISDQFFLDLGTGEKERRKVARPQSGRGRGKAKKEKSAMLVVRNEQDQ